MTDKASARKLDRMLLWFEASLPGHDIGGWFFEVEPDRRTLVDERPGTRIDPPNYGRTGILAGYGECLRCGRRFDLPRCGNFSVHDDAEQERLARDHPSLTHAGLIATAKKWILKDAERAGKCWGGIPDAPESPE